MLRRYGSSCEVWLALLAGEFRRWSISLAVYRGFSSFLYCYPIFRLCIQVGRLMGLEAGWPPGRMCWVWFVLTVDRMVVLNRTVSGSLFEMRFVRLLGLC